ncbi:MAG: hypothetical protein V1729_05275 [Candidatus Woesearchaeota archaeon]
MVSRKKIVISAIILFTLVISLLSVFVFAAGGLRAACETNTDCDTASGLRCFQMRGVSTGSGVVDTMTCRYSACRTRAVNTGSTNCQCQAAGRDPYYFCQPNEKCDTDVGCIPAGHASLNYCSPGSSSGNCICKQGNSYQVCAPGVACDMTGGGCGRGNVADELAGPADVDTPSQGSERIDDELPASGNEPVPEPRQQTSVDLSGMYCPTSYGEQDTITNQCMCKKAAGGTVPCARGQRCSSLLGCYSVQIDRSGMQTCSYGATVTDSSGACLCTRNGGREEVCGTDTMCTQAYGCRSITQSGLGNLDITTVRCTYGQVTSECLCDAAQNSGMCRAGSTCTEASGCVSSAAESENIDDFIPTGPGALGNKCAPVPGCSNGLVCRAPSLRADRICTLPICGIDLENDIPCECYGKDKTTAQICAADQICMRQIGCQSKATLDEKKTLGNAGRDMKCVSTDDCDPGLLCRAPSARADKVCTPPLCSVASVLDDSCMCYAKGEQQCMPGQVCLSDFGCVTEEISEQDKFRFAIADKYTECSSTSECKNGLVCRRVYGDTKSKCMPKPCTVDGTADSLCSCFSGGVMQECKVGQVCQTSKGCQGEATTAAAAAGQDFSKCDAQTCSVIQVKLNGPDYSNVFVRQKAPKPSNTMSPDRVLSPVQIIKDTKYSVVVSATKSDVKCLRINGKDYSGRSKKFTIWDDWTASVRGYSAYADGKCAGEAIPTAGASVSFTTGNGEHGRASGDAQDCDKRYNDLLGMYGVLNERANDYTLPPEERTNVFRGAQTLLQDLKNLEQVCGAMS